VKISHLLATLAAGTLFFSVILSQVAAQQPAAQQPANSAGIPIAVIDTNFIMKNHARFDQMMKQLQADVQAADQAAKQEADEIRKLAERLESYNSGTPDYKSIEEAVAKRQSEFQVRTKLQRKEFLQREAKICHMVYTEIMQEVDYFAANHGVLMVFRVNNDRVDTEKPDEVLRDISKPIIWYPQGCNITQYILERVNRNAMNVGARPDAPSRPGVPLR